MRTKMLPIVAAVLVLAASIAPARPAAARGDGAPCNPSPPQLKAQFHSPQHIEAVSDAPCLAPGASAPGSFGPRAARPVNFTPQPGSSCDLTFEGPIQYRLNGTTPEYQRFYPTGDVAQAAAPTGVKRKIGVNADTVRVLDPASVTWQGSGWQSYFDPRDVGIVSMDGYQNSGTVDYYTPWEFRGTWNAHTPPQCVSAPIPPGGPAFWMPCDGPYNRGCSLSYPPPAPVVGGPLAVGALQVDLHAFLQGQFRGGRISSLPDGSPHHEGLVNTATCFYVTGMSVTGDGDPLQDEYWEQIVEGPELPGTEGRHIYYSFVIHVYHQGTEWNFGDNTPTESFPGGRSATAPNVCADKPDQQFLVAHTYKRYSTDAGFSITMTHHYSVDVIELWLDGTGAHRADYPNQLALNVPAENQPYLMPVVQEEGVPGCC